MKSRPKLEIVSESNNFLAGKWWVDYFKRNNVKFTYTPQGDAYLIEYDEDERDNINILVTLGIFSSHEKYINDENKEGN